MVEFESSLSPELHLSDTRTAEEATLQVVEVINSRTGGIEDAPLKEGGAACGI